MKIKSKVRKHNFEDETQPSLEQKSETLEHTICRLLCTGKTNSPFPVSVRIPSKLLRPYLSKTCRAGILSSK